MKIGKLKSCVSTDTFLCEVVVASTPASLFRRLQRLRDSCDCWRVAVKDPPHLKEMTREIETICAASRGSQTLAEELPVVIACIFLIGLSNTADGVTYLADFAGRLDPSVRPAALLASYIHRTVHRHVQVCGAAASLSIPAVNNASTFQVVLQSRSAATSSFARDCPPPPPAPGVAQLGPPVVHVTSLK